QIKLYINAGLGDLILKRTGHDNSFYIRKEKAQLRNNSPWEKHKRPTTYPLKIPLKFIGTNNINLKDPLYTLLL
ncbi:hypothetical protein, partial [Chimaeribacter arupi]|uniref:hypothetical protein n=1 Tax=Chimaeribacter arupi TaxID=2060066 RepID=UPI000CBFE1E5